MLPRQERPGIKATHLPATQFYLDPVTPRVPTPSRLRVGRIHLHFCRWATGTEAPRGAGTRKVLEELRVPHTRGPVPPRHPRLTLRHRGAPASPCRPPPAAGASPPRCAGTTAAGPRPWAPAAGSQAQRPPAPAALSFPPHHVRSRVCVCARRGGARGRTQWKFPLPAAATAAAAAGRRKAGAGPEPPQGGGGRRPHRGSARPARARSPAAGVPLPPPLPRAGAAGQPAGGRAGGGGGPPAGGRVRGGGGAWRGQGAARRSLRSCWRPLSRAARPPARVSVQLGSRAGRSRRQHRLPPGTRLPPPVPPSPASPPPPPPHPLPRRIPAPPATASSKMPRYELALILKAMQRPETAAVLKRTVETLMEKGAIVRNLENLGERSLPYKISKHKERHRRGGYFLIDLEGPPSIVSTMMDHLGRDIDVIRRAFIKHPLSKTEECSGIIPVNYEDKLIAKKK
ncbi:small ribosomal subunit protein bS6m [Mycteria americana]|uniref:small ribosomal subunit protein bS6m n=1 Tax=Mycteria americana TaxID=33587 RepID=UPI003F58A32F